MKREGITAEPSSSSIAGVFRSFCVVDDVPALESDGTQPVPTGCAAKTRAIGGER